MRLIEDLSDRFPPRTLALLAGSSGLFVAVGVALPLLFAPRMPGGERGQLAAAPAAAPVVATPSRVDASVPELAGAPQPSALTAPAPGDVASAAASVPGTPAAIATRAVPPILAATPAPTAPVSDAPVRAVRAFYRVAEDKQFQAAEQLWTQRMRGAFPPSENIVQRFARTQQLSVEDVRLLVLDEAAGRATVGVVVLERLDPAGTRRYRGTWDLVRAGGVWLLDQPDLHLE